MGNATSQPYNVPAGDKIKVLYQNRSISFNEFLNLPHIDDPNFQQLQRGLRLYADSQNGLKQLESLADKYDTLFSGEADLLIKVQQSNEAAFAACFDEEKNEILFSPQLLSRPHSYIPNRDRAVPVVMMHETSHALDDDMLEKQPNLQKKYETEMNAKLAEVKLEVELFEKSGELYTNSLSNFAREYYLQKKINNAEYADQWFKWYLVSSPNPQQAVCSWRRFYSKDYAHLETTSPLLNVSAPPLPHTYISPPHTPPVAKTTEKPDVPKQKKVPVPAAPKRASKPVVKESLPVHKGKVDWSKCRPIHTTSEQRRPEVTKTMEKVSEPAARKAPKLQKKAPVYEGPVDWSKYRPIHCSDR